VDDLTSRALTGTNIARNRFKAGSGLCEALVKLRVVDELSCGTLAGVDLVDGRLEALHRLFRLGNSTVEVVIQRIIVNDLAESPFAGIRLVQDLVRRDRQLIYLFEEIVACCRKLIHRDRSG